MCIPNSMWEIGLSVMSIEQLCEFSSYFNYSIDYVLGLTNNRKNINNKKFSYNNLGINRTKVKINFDYPCITTRHFCFIESFRLSTDQLRMVATLLFLFYLILSILNFAYIFLILQTLY